MMSKKSLFLVLLMAMVTCMPIYSQYKKVQVQAGQANKPLRLFAKQQKQLFNFGWRFKLAEKDEQAQYVTPSLDDSSWQQVDLPHDFQFEQPWSQAYKGNRGFKPMCDGWYRKTFKADPLWKGMKVSLDFDGIIYLGDVYLNGHKIASTDYGYVGLEADLTPYLRYDADNVVAVYASTGPNKGSRWYTGGGLFRDVYLKIQNPTHITKNGVFVSTPVVTKTKATVDVQVEVDGWQKQNVRIESKIKDANGILVGENKSGMPTMTHQTCTEVKLPAVNIANPHLWSPENPYLYQVDVVVYSNDVAVDSLHDTFGIRKLEFSPEFGFKLNGEKYFLKGNAGHHDLGALGAASFDTGIERMMLQLKKFGYNTIRCSHNPYSENFTRIADRVGMIVVDELIDKWSDDAYWGGRQPFTHIWSKLIPEWIKRDRNRASVILWSLGNELQIREPWTGFAGMNDWGITTYRIFNQMVKRFDPTRLTTVAMFPARAGAIDRHDKEFEDYLVPPELSQVTEVASLNYQSAKYKDYLKYNPKMIIFQSEAETYKMLEPYYNMDYERTVGMAYWGSIEYWGESNGWPKKGWNYSFFAHDLHPYPQAYLVRSAFKPAEPIVRIGVVDTKGGESVSWNDVIVGRPLIYDHWNFEKGSKQTVVTYTNAYSVELIVNGTSMGVKKNEASRNDQKNSILWTGIDYGNGGSIIAIARNELGECVAKQKILTAGKAVSLKIEPETKHWKANGMDLLYLHVTAVDKNGTVVPDFEGELSVSLENQNAKVQAMDNGDHYSNDLYTGVTSKKMFQGRMLVILRSMRQPGQVKVKVVAGNMKKSYTAKME